MNNYQLAFMIIRSWYTFMPKMSGLDIKKSADAVEIEIIASPKAKKDRIIGTHDGALKISVTAPADKGKANEAIIKLLSKFFGIPVSSVTIVSGHSSRRKRIRMESITAKGIIDSIDGNEQ
ncbi:MAG: DUF167 domain-containing protein [bacterium]